MAGVPRHIFMAATPPTININSPSVCYVDHVAGYTCCDVGSIYCAPENEVFGKALPSVDSVIS